MLLSFVISRCYQHLAKSVFIIVTMMILPQAHANYGCQLDKGYELPENVSFNWLCTFNNDISAAENQLTNKYGAVNRKGAVKIPFEYDSPVEFWQDKALVKQNDKWLIIDTDNQQLAEFDFQDAGNFGSTGLASFQQNDKWGYINTEGDIVIEPQFDSIEYGFGYPRLNENVIAIFRRGGKFGAIDRTGKIIISAQFDEIRQASNVLFVINDEKMGIYDYEGHMVQPVEFEINNGFYSDGRWTNENWLPIIKNEKVGAIDKRGNIVVPIEFDDVEIIGESAFKVFKNGKYGIYGVNNLITPLQYDYIADSLEKPTRVKKEGKWGYLDNFDSLMLIGYDEADDFSEGLAMVGNHQQQHPSTEDKSILWGYINTTGEEVIPLHYEDVRAFNEGLAPVKANGKWGVIDFQENQIVPFEYDVISSFEDGYAIVAKNTIDASNNSTSSDKAINDTIEYSLSSISDNDLHFDNFMLRENAKMEFGMINSRGDIVLPVDYENITRVSEGMIGVKNEGKWGFANQQGELVLPYQFDQIFPPFKEGIIQVDTCFDENEITIPCESDEVNFHTLHIDKQGNIINESWSSMSVVEDIVAVEEATD